MENNIVSENDFDELNKFINDPKNIIELANELAKYDYEKNFEGKSEKEIDDMYFYFLKKGIYGEKRRRHCIRIEGKNNYFMDTNEFEVELNDYGQDRVSESGKKIDDVHFPFLEEKSKVIQKKQEPDCYSDGYDWIFNKKIGKSDISRIDVLRGYCKKGYKFDCVVEKAIDEKNSIITMLKHMIILDILALRYMGFDLGKNNNLTIKEKIADYCKSDLVVERRKAFLVDKTRFNPKARSLYSSWSGMLVLSAHGNYLGQIVYGTSEDSFPYRRHQNMIDEILSSIFARYIKYLMYNSMNGIESVENNGWTLEERMMHGVGEALKKVSTRGFVDIFVDYLNSTNELEKYFFYGDKACNFKSCFCKSLDKFGTVCSYIVKNNPNAFDEFYLKVGDKKFIEQMILFLDCKTIVEIENGKTTYDQEYKNMLSNKSKRIGKRLAIVSNCLKNEKNRTDFENAFRERLNQNKIEDNTQNEIFEVNQIIENDENNNTNNNSYGENNNFTENNFRYTFAPKLKYISIFMYIFLGLTIIFALLILVYTYFFYATLTFLILSVICLIIKFCYDKNENDIYIKPQGAKTNTIALNKYIEKNENDLNLEDTNKIILTRDYQEEN